MSLIVRLQRQDDTALEPLIELTRDRAYRLAWSLLQDRHQCEDALQDAYLTVYRSIGQLRRPEAFQTWFFRIVSNRCKRMLRQKPSASLELVAEVADRSRPDHEVSERMALRSAVADLKPNDREVLALRESMQLTYEEIAAALRVPLSTVRSRLNKARRRLLEILMPGGRP